jgi:gamma-glutamyltranspeptidase/glutathione hydrolase
VHFAHGQLAGANHFQGYIFNIVSPIFSSTPESLKIYGSPTDKTKTICAGEFLRQPQLADFLEQLGREGEELFYRGDVARLITETCAVGGGLLNTDDLESYRVIKRQPLELNYQQARILTNPPPSSGGILIAFALKLLEDSGISRDGFGSPAYMDFLALTMDLTNKGRLDARLDEAIHPHSEQLLHPDYLRVYKEQILGRAQSTRGTTHISVMDSIGNTASLSTSNGEGCGHILPGTGIMMNNMLGEEDLNPNGFHLWPPAQRMTSMMAPTLVHSANDTVITLGSGGSNRLRTAILQVLLNLLEFGMSLEEAVNSPRLHFEAGIINAEADFGDNQIDVLLEHYPQCKIWPERNLFFGGTHAVMQQNGIFSGVGDPRRGGVAKIVS